MDLCRGSVFRLTRNHEMINNNHVGCQKGQTNVQTMDNRILVLTELPSTKV